jgi:hypothetical protein
MLLDKTTAFILFYSPFFSLLCCTLDARQNRGDLPCTAVSEAF